MTFNTDSSSGRDLIKWENAFKTLGQSLAQGYSESVRYYFYDDDGICATYSSENLSTPSHLRGHNQF